MYWTFNLCPLLKMKNSNSQYIYFLTCKYVFPVIFTFSYSKKAEDKSYADKIQKTQDNT